jgi:hypothetical protein
MASLARYIRITAARPDPINRPKGHPLFAVAPERETLQGFLEYHRRVLSGKLRGLSEQDARRRLVPSATTMIGLVSHAAAVERNWFQHYLGGRPREEITGNARGDDPSWDVGAGTTIGGVIAEFERACDQGARPAHRARRHPPRADRRRDRRLTFMRRRRADLDEHRESAALPEPASCLAGQM